MKPIQQIFSKELYWKQPRWSREYYELFAGGKPVNSKVLLATIAWTRCLSEEVSAATHQSKWTFDRVGFLERRTVAWDETTSEQVAVVHYGWLGDGEINMADGNTYVWNRSKTLSPAWMVSDSTDQPVFEIELGIHWIKQEGFVILDPARTHDADLDLLLPLSFYMAVCAQRDTAAAVAATTAATG